MKTFQLFTLLAALQLHPSVSHEEGLRGWQKSREEPRNLIVGGTEVNELHYPYLAYLEVIGARGNPKWSCGGTLIHPEWILTSAQCLINATEVTAILGAHDITNACDEGGPDIECHSIDVGNDVHSFPEYDSKALQADFALIQLAIPSTKNTALVNLDYSMPAENDNVWLAGRGGTGGTSTFSAVPMETQATVVSHEECEKDSEEPIVPDLQCAKGDGLYNTCYGDSGGPVIIKAPEDIDNAKDILVGVISWGFSPACPASARPTVYGRVASILSWIISTAPELKTEIVNPDYTPNYVP